jgi:hypothetical protein
MSSDGRVLKTPSPDVYVDPSEGGIFSLTGRCWTAPADVDAVRQSMRSQAGIRLAVLARQTEAPGAATPAPRQ